MRCSPGSPRSIRGPLPNWLRHHTGGGFGGRWTLCRRNLLRRAMTGRFLTSLAIVASLSCAARSDARKAGTITYQNLVPGGMAIGGVTSRIKGRTSEPGSRETMAQMFEEAILNSRADVPLMGA